MILKIKTFLDKCLEITLMVSVGVLVIDVLWQVFTRKVLGSPSKYTEELAIFLLIWVALLGSAVALGRGAHLGIDYFVGKLKEKQRTVIEVAVFVLILLFSAFVMVGGGIDLVITTFALDQKSPAFEVPMGYVYLAVPLSGIFMVIYSWIGMVERIAALMSKETK